MILLQPSTTIERGGIAERVPCFAGPANIPFAPREADDAIRKAAAILAAAIGVGGVANAGKPQQARGILPLLGVQGGGFRIAGLGFGGFAVGMGGF